MGLSGFVWAITPIFMHGFQNHLAKVFSFRRSSAILKYFLDRLKVNVTLEGQLIKWSKTGHVLAITSTFMHGFQNSFA